MLSNSKEHVTILGKNLIYAKLFELLMATKNDNICATILITLSHILSFMEHFAMNTSAFRWFGSELGEKLVAR